MSGIVSVIIPTYNRASFLREAVLSVHAQSYRPIECIVVDDGSTDETPEVIGGLQQFDTNNFRLLYLQQDKSGAQVARNNGTAASKGEFIQYLDSDDLLFAYKLEQQVNYLNQHPECDGVFGDWRRGLPNESALIRAYSTDNMIAQFLTDRCIANFSFLMRRVIVRRIGEWDPKIKRNQEVDFHIRGLLLNAQFHYLPGCSGLWRQHQQERVANTTNLFDILFFYKKMEQLLSEKNLFTNTMKEKIATQFVWFLSEYKSRSDHELVAVMKEIVRLNPDTAFYKSKKLRLLKSIMGQNLAFRFWLEHFRRSIKGVR